MLLCGCGGGTGLEGDARLDREADTATDTVEPGPQITFRLSFVTDIPGHELLYVQTSDYEGHQRWADISGASLQERCDICTCEECTGCPVCGPAMPAVAALGSGESIEWTWNGVTHPTGTCVEGPGGPEHICKEQGNLEPGTYPAVFCFEVAGPDAFPEGWLESPACVDVEFVYPVPGGVVEHLVNNSG
jgi:hypothetical protein